MVDNIARRVVGKKKGCLNVSKESPQEARPIWILCTALKWKVRTPDQVYEDVSTIGSCCAARLIVAALYDHNVTGRELS